MVELDEITNEFFEASSPITQRSPGNKIHIHYFLIKLLIKILNYLMKIFLLNHIHITFRKTPSEQKALRSNVILQF